MAWIRCIGDNGGQPTPVIPTSNLWGGLQMAIDIIKAGLSSAGAADDYVSLTGSYKMNNRVVVDDIFEANKQYTFILAYENNSTYSGGSITANLLFRYSDDSYDTLTITGKSANTKYTHAFVSAEGKTVTSIQCTYNWETAKIYYEESGVFEGVKTVEDFEPYNRYGGGGNYTSINYTTVPNTYIDGGTGAETPYTGWSSTDYIDISEIDGFYVIGIAGGYNAWYDNSKTCINTFVVTDDYITPPAGAKYMRLSDADAKILKMKIFTKSDVVPTPFNIVLTQGQISMADPNGAYTTATFSDISDYEYVCIKGYDTVGGTDYENTIIIKVSDIPVNGYKNFAIMLHRNINCRITRTSVSSWEYSGSFVNIYCDITGTTEDIFPTT